MALTIKTAQKVQNFCVPKTKGNTTMKETIIPSKVNKCQHTSLVSLFKRTLIYKSTEKGGVYDNGE